MIDLEFVQSLIRALDESSLDNLELERGGTRIRLSKSPAPLGGGEGAVTSYSTEIQTAGKDLSAAEAVSSAVGVEAEALAKKYLEVTSPMVGTFYRSPGPDSPPYVDVGSKIGRGTVLCIIEAMKLMNELESEVQGTVVKIMVEDAQPVEYGQLLFLIDPS